MKKALKIFTMFCMVLFATLLTLPTTSFAASAPIVVTPTSAYSYEAQKITIEVPLQGKWTAEVQGYPGMLTFSTTEGDGPNRNFIINLSANPEYESSSSKRTSAILFKDTTGNIIYVYEIDQKSRPGSNPDPNPYTSGYFSIMSSPFDSNNTANVSASTKSLTYVCSSNRTLTVTFGGKLVAPTNTEKLGNGWKYTYYLNFGENTTAFAKTYTFTVAGDKQYTYTIKQDRNEDAYNQYFQNTLPKLTAKLGKSHYVGYGYHKFNDKKSVSQEGILLLKGFNKGGVLGVQFDEISTTDVVILEVYKENGQYKVRKVSDLGTTNGLGNCNGHSNGIYRDDDIILPVVPHGERCIPKKPDSKTAYFKTADTDYAVYYVMQTKEFKYLNGTLKYSGKSGLYTTKSNYKMKAVKLFTHDFTKYPPTSNNKNGGINVSFSVNIGF